MRRLTLREVNEDHGGLLPPDATLRSDDEESVRPAPVGKPKRRTRSERFAALSGLVGWVICVGGPLVIQLGLPLFGVASATG